MPDNINFGIGVTEQGDGAALVDRMRQKLEQYRLELEKFENVQFGKRSNGDEQAYFRSVNSAAEGTIQAYAQIGRSIDLSSKEAVTAFRAQAAALREFLDVSEVADSTIERLDTVLVNLSQNQQRAAAAARAANAAAVGGNAPSSSVALAGASSEVAAASGAVAGLGSEVNALIGEFQKLGSTIDTTSLEAVTAYRLQGDALASNINRMGATTQELNQVGAAVARVERAYGAARIATDEENASMTRIPVTARRGADAFATLAFGIQAGGVSMRTTAIAIGSTTAALAQFADSARLAAAASGIGAFITILATVVGVFYDLNHEAEKTENTLGNLGDLSVSALKTMSKALDTQIAAAQTAALAAANLAHRDILPSGPEEASGTGYLESHVAAALQAKHAHDLQVYYQKLIDLRAQLTKALVSQVGQEDKEVSDMQRQDSENADQLLATRLYGQLAERRLAADQELKDEKEKLAKLSGTEAQHRAAEEALDRQHSERLLAIQEDYNKERQSLTEKIGLQLITEQEKTSTDEFFKQIQSADRARVAMKEEINNNKDIVNNPDPSTRNNLLKEADDVFNATVAAVESQRKDRIKEITDQVQSEMEAVAGQDVDVNRIAEKFHQQIELLKNAIASSTTDDATKAAAQKGIDLINALIPEEVAKARLEDIDKNTSAAVASAQEQIDRTNALLNARSITVQDSQKAMLAATIAQRDAVASAIPLLEAQAALIPGDTADQAKIEALKTKLLELNITVKEMSDSFYQLKETGISATEDALTAMLQNLPSVVVQNSQQQNNINAIKDHLAAANEQLQYLLNGPQTPGTAQQIAAIRSEIQATDIELNNARRQLTTWQSLFKEAAASIVKSLLDVETRMLAVYLVQKALGFVASVTGSTATGIQVAGDSGSGGVFAASGGYITGPGTELSDSIPAHLSHGEYVVRASAVRTLGVAFFDAINQAGAMPTMAKRARGYAAGGLVTPDRGSGHGGFDATIGLEEGLVARHINSRAGTKAVVNVIGQNRKIIRSLLGG